MLLISLNVLIFLVFLDLALCVAQLGLHQSLSLHVIQNKKIKEQADMKKWTLAGALMLGVVFVSYAGGEMMDGKTVREKARTCYWSEGNTFTSNLVVPEDKKAGGKETDMRYICDNATYPIVRSRNFISDAQPDTWKTDGRDKHYSLTRW